MKERNEVDEGSDLDHNRSSDDLFKIISDNSPDAIFIMNEGGDCAYANQASSDLLGYTIDEITSMNIKDVGTLGIGGEPFQKLIADGRLFTELELRKKDGTLIPVDLNAVILPNGLLFGSCRDLTQRKVKEGELESIAWMLSSSINDNDIAEHTNVYGDLSLLNDNGLILRSVGKKRLMEIVSEYLPIIGTSSAIYEENGDYACGIFSSNWCRFLDRISRDLCDTHDNGEALRSGKWLCHESCWKDCSKPSMEKGDVTDILCSGGIHLFGVPIFANGHVIGSINVGYGDPPKNEGILGEIADRYGVDIQELKEFSEKYPNRPQFIIEIVKERLKHAAREIGLIVESKLFFEELKNTLDATTDGIWTWDFVTNELTFSTRYYTMLGYENGEFPASFESWKGLIHPEDLEKASKIADDYLNKKPDVYENEFRMRKKDGEYRWIRAKGKVVKRGNDNEALYMIGNHEDMTERKEVDKKIREREEKFRTIMELSPFPMWIADEKGTLQNANKALKSVLNLSDEQLIGKYNILKDENLQNEKIKSKIIEVFEEHKVAHFKLFWESGRIKHTDFSDSRDLWIDVTMFPLLNDENEMTNIVCQWIDITERKEAEIALWLKNSVFDVSIAAMSIANTEGIITEANDAFLRVWNISSKEEVIGKPISHFLKNAEEAEKIITSLNKSGNWEGDYIAVKGDGSTFAAYGLASILKDEDDNFIGYQSSVLDVTDRKQYENNLLQSISLQQATLESTADGILVVDLEGRIVDHNNNFLEIWNLSEKILKDGKTRDLVSPENAEYAMKHIIGQLVDPGKFISKVQELYSKPEAESFDVLNFKDGKIIERYSKPQYFHDKPVGRVWSFRDITERKEAVEALKESEEKYRILFENAPIMLGVLDSQGKYIDLNSSVYRMLGFTEEEMKGTVSFEYVHPEDRDLVLDAFAQLEKSGVGEATYRFRHKNGNQRTMRSKAIKMPNQDLILVYSDDITEIEEAEKALRESEKKFRTLFENSADIIVLLDLEGNILDINKVAPGYNMEDVLTTPWENFLTPEQKILFKNALNKSIETGEPHGYEADIPSPLGVVQNWFNKISPVFEGKKMRSIIVTCTEITDLKQAQIELVNKNDEVEFFMDLLGHDLGNIHQGIAGSLQLLHGKMDKVGTIGKVLNLANESVNNATYLTKEVLLLSKLRHEEIDLQVIDLNEIINKVKDQIEATFQDRDIDITANVGENKVLAEPILNELFFNLLHNAVKVQGKEPSIEIKAEKKGDMVRIEVIDEGPGIPDNMKPELFNRFGQKGEKIRRGIGLSIVKLLAERYNGTVEVKDRIKGDHTKGAKFIVKFPSA